MELPDLGANCSFGSCTSYDFLPFKCPRCSLQFCPTHRQIADHACTNSNDVLKDPNAPSSFVETRQKCAVTECSTEDLPALLSLCPGCETRYCLKHRHAVDHECASLGVDQKVKEDKKKEIKDFVASKMGTASGSAATASKSDSSKTATASAAKPKKLNLQIEIMKMKSKAKV